MLTLPNAIIPILAPFVTLFTNLTCRKAQLLLDQRGLPTQSNLPPPLTVMVHPCLLKDPVGTECVIAPLKPAVFGLGHMWSSICVLQQETAILVYLRSDHHFY